MVGISNGIGNSERPGRRRDAQCGLDLERQPKRWGSRASRKLVGVGFADPNPLEVSSFDRGEVAHAALCMRNAYSLTRPKVCSLRHDAPACRMQNAHMADPKNNLASWRRFRHLTQEELAELVGTTKAVISNLETGARGLSDKWLRRLAPALNTSPGYIMDHDPNDLPTAVLDVWSAIPDADRPRALEVLKAFRTGTDG